MVDPSASGDQPGGGSGGQAGIGWRAGYRDYICDAQAAQVPQVLTALDGQESREPSAFALDDTAELKLRL